MNSRFASALTGSLAVAALFLVGCSHLEITHVAPGDSLGVALSKKPELVKLPSTPAPTVAANGQPGAVPAVEPNLPTKNDPVEKVAEAFSRGQFCMDAGKDKEAIEAFEEAVRLDPTFTEAWQHLAMLYENVGDNKKAVEAFKRAKKIAARQ